MKKIFFILTIIFTVLTLIGALYVLFNRGRVNAGYAVVPMLFTLVSMAFYRQKT